MKPIGGRSRSKAAIIALAAALACANTGGCQRHEPVLPPEVVVNEDAGKRILFSIEVAGADADVRDISGRVQYDITNAEHCMPVDMTLAIGGARRNFPQTHEMQRSAGKGGDFYLLEDYLKDGDYYRLGTCHWGITSVEFKANVDGKHVNFWMSGDDVRAMKAVRRRCLLPRYRKSDADDGCRKDAQDDARIDGDNEYFRVSMTPRRG